MIIWVADSRQKPPGFWNVQPRVVFQQDDDDGVSEAYAIWAEMARRYPSEAHDEGFCFPCMYDVDDAQFNARETGVTRLAIVIGSHTRTGKTTFRCVPVVRGYLFGEKSAWVDTRTRASNRDLFLRLLDSAKCINELVNTFEDVVRLVHSNPPCR